MLKKILYILFSYIFFVSISFAKPKELDKTKPVKVEADEIKIQKNNNTIIFTGNVKTTQENLNMFSDNMNVIYTKDKNDKITIKTIVAEDNVVLKNENITAKGDRAVYNFRKQLITVKGNIILNEKDAVVFGDVLTYNINTRETKINTVENKKNTTNKKRVVIILDNVNDLKDRYDKK